MVTDSLQNQPSPITIGGHAPTPGLVDPDKLYSIGQAAQILGVSIDTMRRWEQKGTLKAQRTAGMLRRFTGKELLDYQKEAQNQDLLVPISKAAQELHVSIQTLRRWDKSGKLLAERGTDGGRMYRLKTIRDISHGLKSFPGLDANEQETPRQKKAFVEGKNNSSSNTTELSANTNFPNQTAHALALTDNTPLDTSMQVSEEPQDIIPASPLGDTSKGIPNSAQPPLEDVNRAPQQDKSNSDFNKQTEEKTDKSYAHEVQQLVDSVAQLADETPLPPAPAPEDMPQPNITPISTPSPPAPEPVELDVPATNEPAKLEKLTITLVSTASQLDPAFNAAGALTRPAIEDHGQNSCGSAVMPAKCNKVVIKTTAITTDSHIFVTPTVALEKPLFVAMALANEGFAVACVHPPLIDVSFHWLVVDAIR